MRFIRVEYRGDLFGSMIVSQGTETETQRIVGGITEPIRWLLAPLASANLSSARANVRKLERTTVTVTSLMTQHAVFDLR